MSELTRWDIKIWLATLVTVAFGAFAAFLAAMQIPRYEHYAAISYGRQEVLADAHWSEGWPHLVARVVALAVVFVVSLPGIVYLRDRSLRFGRVAKIVVIAMTWLSFLVGFAVSMNMTGIDKRCCLRRVAKPSRRSDRERDRHSAGRNRAGFSVVAAFQGTKAGEGRPGRDNRCAFQPMAR